MRAMQDRHREGAGTGADKEGIRRRPVRMGWVPRGDRQTEVYLLCRPSVLGEQARQGGGDKVTCPHYSRRDDGAYYWPGGRKAGTAWTCQQCGSSGMTKGDKVQDRDDAVISEEMLRRYREAGLC